MGKKRHRRRSPPQRKRKPGEPDELTELPFGYIARWGRFMTMQGTLSADEHVEMIEAFLAEGTELRRKQAARRTSLLEILDEADAVDLVARASLTYLHIDPDTFKEWESDRSPAHIEYLALQALGAESLHPKGVDPIRQWELTWEAIALVREMFSAASMLITMDAIAARRKAPDDPTVEYTLKTRLESLGVRGTGYAEHLIRVIRGCFDPFDRECRELLGFTATEALTLTYGIAAVISDRLEPLWEEATAGRTETLRHLKHERRHRRTADRHFPDWLLDLPPTQARMQVSAMVTAWLFADSRGLATVTPDDLASRLRIDASACRAFLDAFTCPKELFKEEHHGLPGGAHPLTTQPVLNVDDDGYVLPVASSMVDAIRPRMEDLLADTPAWERYADARGKYVEREATTLLSSALPASRSWTSIAWQSSRAASDLDGLVTTDNFAARVQAKAGRLSAQARRGAPLRMKHDIGVLIEDAAEQHAKLAAALSSEGATAIGFSAAQAAAFEARFQMEAIVCLDDVTVWATEAHDLKKLGALPYDRHVPWVLSLTDLMAIVDLLEGAQLVHYLLRRQRIERDGRITAHDELDWVGHYISEGLFFDRYFDREDPPHLFRLLSYTEPIDAWYFTRDGVRTIEAPKPAQEIPANLDQLIQRLERERPRDWMLAVVALLDGDQESRELWDRAVVHAGERLPQVGWSNASQGFNERFGVALYVDLRIDSPAIRAHVADYCRTKAEELNESNWIGVGEGATGGLFVSVIEREEGKWLADAFVEPPASPAALATSAAS